MSKVAVIAAAAANTNPPTLVTDGVPLFRGKGKGIGAPGLWDWMDEAMVSVDGTGADASLSVVIKIWVYSGYTSQWYPLGAASSGQDADRGKLNNAHAIGIIAGEASNLIRHTEKIAGLRGMDRIYAQVLNLLGASPSINVTVVGRSTSHGS